MITLNHNEIKQIMAHRHPMLLVDRVIELEKGKYIVAEKSITANEPCYQYIPHDMYNLSAFAYPVSLLIESFGQAMCILVAETNEINLNTSIQIPVFGFVQGGHFYEDAYPGDTMIHKGKIIKNTGDAVFCEGETFVGNKCIAKVEMAAIALKSAEMVLSKNN